MATVTERRTSIQYDGTNGSYIAGTWSTGIGFVSDTGTIFTYSDRDNAHQTASLNQWLIVNSVDDGYPVVMDTAGYQSYFAVIPSGLRLAAGYALTPTILASASANVAVGLDTAMEGTGYEFTAVLAGDASLLGDLQITGAVATDSSTVTVTVQNTGLASLAGATVIVCAAQLVEA